MRMLRGFVPGVALVAAVAVIALVVRAPVAETWAAGEAPEMSKAPGAQPEGARLKAWLPPGTYDQLVITTTGEKRRWIVTLVTRSGRFPIAVAAGETTIVPFPGGWDVTAQEEARLESRYVPFADISERNLLGGDERLELSAWGVRGGAPVELVYRE